MKYKNYWLCNDAQGMYLYCGNQQPVLEGDTFTSNEFDSKWVDIDLLDTLNILYPKNLPIGTCKQIKFKFKSKW